MGRLFWDLNKVSLRTKKHLSYLSIFIIAGLLVVSLYFQSPKARGIANLRIQKFSGLGLNFALADTAATSATVGNAFPSVSNVSLNAGANITLIESTIKSADVTGQISDDNLCSDISGVTAMVYVTSLDTSCSADDNSCYVSISCNTSDCDTSAGSTQTSADVTCTASLWFHSNPETWEASILVTDAASATAEDESASAVTVLTLNALDVTSSIAYGSVSAGSTTASNQSVGVTATGNAAIDCSLQGTDMTATTGTIRAPKQKYGLTDVAYASLTSSLSTTDDALDLACAKPTQNSPVQAGAIDIVYWGLGVDVGTPTDTDYSGYNTFTAVSGEDCADGVDNDGDGDTDCADTDCDGVVSEPVAGQKVICEDNLMWSETLADGYEWGCYETEITGADSTTDGEQNTADILAECTSGSRAAYGCDNLDHAGFTDWYLPAKDTLAALYPVCDDGVCGTSCSWDSYCCSSSADYPDSYWSSTEYSSVYAWHGHFNGGGSHAYDKDDSYSVRCVRQ